MTWYKLPFDFSRKLKYTIFTHNQKLIMSIFLRLFTNPFHEQSLTDSNYLQPCYSNNNGCHESSTNDPNLKTNINKLNSLEFSEVVTLPLEPLFPSQDLELDFYQENEPLASTPQHRNGRKPQRRKVIKTDDPRYCLQESPLSREKKELLVENHLKHASSRVETFAKTAICMQNTALRSDPEKVRNLEIGIGRAYLQLGKGSNGNHAAHDNAGAGERDTVRKCYMQEMVDEKVVTPLKAEFLKYKGFTTADFDEIYASGFNPEKIEEVFNRYWPNEAWRPSSILEGSRGEYDVNKTTIVKRRINLGCDRRAERTVRPIMEELYKAVSVGALQPEEATQRFKATLIDHFRGAQTDIQQRLSAIAAYKTALENFAKYPPISFCHLEGDFFKLLALRLDTQTTSSHKVAKVYLFSNDKFLESLNRKIKLSKDTNIPLSPTWQKRMVNQIGYLKWEVNQEEAKFQDHLEHCRIQEEGTRQMDVHAFFNSIKDRSYDRDSVSEVRKVLNFDSFDEIKTAMLSPLQPRRQLETFDPMELS